MKSLVRLVYRSRSALDPDDRVELDRIFNTSIKNNRSNKITGCLAHPDGHFVQVIEGPSGAVNELLKRVTLDARHNAVVVIGSWKPPTRLFSSWAMARPDVRLLDEPSFRIIHDVGSGAQIVALMLALIANSTTLYPLI